MSTDAAAVMAGIWSAHLDRPVVTGNDDFFDLGGHSLIALEIIATIERELGVSLSLQEFYEHSRLQDIVDFVTVAHR